MSTSAYNMSAIRSILEKGFPTQKLVHFNSVQDVIKYLSKNTGSKISQLSSGELAVIQSSASAATETATTGMTTYAGGVVNISKTTQIWSCIQDYMDEFKYEINARVEYDNGYVKKKLIDVYAEGELGVRTYKRFEYGTNVSGIN